MARNLRPLRPGDIFSLTEFQRSTKQHIKRLGTSGQPAVLTINGRAALVVMSPEAFERIFELASRMETLLAVREGLDSAERGEGVSLGKFDQEFRSRHGLPNRRRATGS